MADSDFALEELMSRADWVRLANQTCFQLRGIQINPHNLTPLLQSFRSESEARQFALSVIETLSAGSLQLSGRDALQVLEQCWTGKTRPSGLGGESNILAQVHVQYSLGAQWEMMKTMNVLAVSRDALPELLRFARAVRPVAQELEKRRPVVASMNIPMLCQRLHHRTLDEDLEAAIQETLLSFRMDEFVGMLHCSEERPYSGIDGNEVRRNGMGGILETVFRITHVGRRDLLDPLVLRSKRRATRALQRTRKTESDEGMVMVEDIERADVCLLITNHIEGSIRQSEIEYFFAKAVRDRRRVCRHGCDLATYENAGLCRYLEEKTAIVKPLLNDVEQDGGTWKSCGLLDDVIDGVNACRVAEKVSVKEETSRSDMTPGPMSSTF